MRFRMRFFGKAVLAVVAVAALSAVVMALWNAVIPSIFIDVRPIDYLHAVGLLILSRILFGGFRGRGGWQGRRQWAKWQSMTPEERETFMRDRRSGCRSRMSASSDSGSASPE